MAILFFVVGGGDDDRESCCPFLTSPNFPSPSLNHNKKGKLCLPASFPL